jgi:hypothetical protein
MFKITTEKETEKQLKFGDVEEDQFFVNTNGNLCQKSSSDVYTTIASKYGKPMSKTEYVVDYNTKIQKIFPKVTKIEF